MPECVGLSPSGCNTRQVLQLIWREPLGTDNRACVVPGSKVRNQTSDSMVTHPNNGNLHVFWLGDNRYTSRTFYPRQISTIANFKATILCIPTLSNDQLTSQFSNRPKSNSSSRLDIFISALKSTLQSAITFSISFKREYQYNYKIYIGHIISNTATCSMYREI